MSPPTFIPEYEAVEIITDELKKAGLTFERKEKVIPGMMTKERWVYWSHETKTKSFRDYGDENPFYFELYNKELNMGIKYVTRSNYHKLGGPNETSTVQGYDLVEIVQEIREKLREYNKTGKQINAVFFYDPMTSGDRNLFNLTGFGNPGKQSVSLLRKQVSAFAEWLKKEKTAGVLQNEKR